MRSSCMPSIGPAPPPRTCATDLEARWASATALVAGARDVLDARLLDGVPPPALVARGWDASLLALEDDELERIEAIGLAARWPTRTPPTLSELLEHARAVTDVPVLGGPGAASGPLRARETPRKHAQVEALVGAVAPLVARAGRVVDVGAGHGHLTRAIAALLAVPAVGVDRDGARVDRARSLVRADAGDRASFVVRDVLREGLAIAPGDCVLGLHACGELGDVLVEAASAVGAAVALVGCCLQKRRQPVRAPLCPVGEHGAALDLPRPLLGLANLSMRDEGVEASRAENLVARERRVALRRLLSLEGHALGPGEEIGGLNRRAAHGPLDALVARAFARRALPAPSARAIDEAGRWAREHHGRMRRLSLPRALLGRALETWVALDRARRLAIDGYEVKVGTAFDASVSARNLAILATRS